MATLKNAQSKLKNGSLLLLFIKINYCHYICSFPGDQLVINHFFNNYKWGAFQTIVFGGNTFQITNR